MLSTWNVKIFNIIPNRLRWQWYFIINLAFTFTLKTKCFTSYVWCLTIIYNTRDLLLRLLFMLFVQNNKQTHSFTRCFLFSKILLTFFFSCEWKYFSFIILIARNINISILGKYGDIGFFLLKMTFYRVLIFFYISWLFWKNPVRKEIKIFLS
jgi:hypothetical protein